MRRINFVLPLYVILLATFTMYTYGFVDPNLTLSTHALYQKFHKPLFELVFFNRAVATVIFVFLILLFSIFYFLFSIYAKEKKLTFSRIKWLLCINVLVLFFSYPAFSYDIFNYILTAKVTFLYKENPYLVMPIEFLKEPNLSFTRAANKTALYGPFWIGLTLFPHLLGFGNIVLSILSFKLFIALLYVSTVFLIWKLTKSYFSVILFAFNPLVVIETLVSAHNDIVMMFLALGSFYFLKQNKIFLASIALTISILIKYATLFLVPIFLYAIYQMSRGRKLNWNNVYIGAALSMFTVFLIAPLREEIYPWYVIWFLSFIVLVPQQFFLLSLAITLSFTTLLRYVPVLYTGSYFGTTPLVKELLTFIPLGVVLIFLLARRFLWQKFFP